MTGLHLVAAGPPGGAPLILLHGLGLDLRLWEGLMAHLPPGLHLLQPDLPGHGASPRLATPSMGGLIRAVEQALDARGVTGAVILGHGLGGLIAQGLAVKRLDLIRAMVLTATGTRLSARSVWDRRIASVRQGGLAAILPEIAGTWFAPAQRGSDLARLWSARLTEMDPAGWTDAAAAMAGSDFHPTTATLTLPTLAIAGGRDAATPADLLRETAGLIRGSHFALIPRAGHLAPAETPADFAALLAEFLHAIGHCD
ncbi:MAG: alpha/beta fold hydrolase [Pseudorhodobacter sp.]